MIKIYVQRNSQNQLQRITIQGHAEYGEYGKDIVCAAVSGISIGLVNAIEKLLGVQVATKSSKPGWLDCCLPVDVDADVLPKVVLLLEAMVEALSDVAAQYPQYVQIHDSIKE